MALTLTLVLTLELVQDSASQPYMVMVCGFLNLILQLSSMQRKCCLRNCVTQYFCPIFDIFEAREGLENGLEGLKLDEIEAANSFPMLPMARR